MSQIIFLYSDVTFTSPFFEGEVNDATIRKLFPYLSQKNHVYELQFPVNANDFLLYIQEQVAKNYKIGLIAMEETLDSEEIKKFNTSIRKAVPVDFIGKNEGFYHFKYALERNTFQNKVEYIFMNNK